MNLYELLEAVKYADPETKAEILDKFYNQERIIVNAMTQYEFKMTERRNHDLKKQKSDSSRSSD